MSIETTPSQASETVNATVTQEASSTPVETQASSTPSSSTEPAVQTTPAAPTYTPNYKFKYPKLDSNEQEEKEFDDWAKGVVNDKNESQIRDLYTKAYGMDFFKQKYAKTSEQLKKLDPIVKTWDSLSKAFNQGDLDTFFKGIQLPEEKLYQYVLDKLNERELPYEKRMEIQQQREIQKKAAFLEQQNQELQTKYQQEQVQLRQYQLDMSMNKPEITSVAQAFDAKVGKPGAFKEEVIKRGLMAFYATGQDISPEQAIQEVLSLYGQPGGAGMQTSGASVTQGQMNGASKPQTPPVLPNVGARGSSPAKRTPKSLSDLKKLAETM